MTDIILIEIKNKIGFITLNSPKSLNSISLEMAQALLRVLNDWKDSNEVQCIFLQGNEKALCAGGDVRKLYDELKNNLQHIVAPKALDFFIHEYSLDYTIHTYPKPIIAWGDGIVMGGGIGIMVGASHRVVTEKTKMAMPEITIGLYPDVAGTWFLNRMPVGWGYYFGLTGARMNAGDALYLGLADYYQDSSNKDSVVNALLETEWTNERVANEKKITTLLKSDHSLIESPVKIRSEFSDHLLKIQSLNEFQELIKDYALTDEWIALGLKSFLAGSPTSARVIYEQLKRGKGLSLAEVFLFELNLSARFSMQPDFPEGVRALLVDKDQKPNWQPSSIDEVSDQSVETYFTPLWNLQDNPLYAFLNKKE